MIEFLYQALHEPHGISVLTSDVAICRARCYAARAEAKDPDLKNLQFSPDPKRPNLALFIINRGKDRKNVKDSRPA